MLSKAVHVMGLAVCSYKLQPPDRMTLSLYAMEATTLAILTVLAAALFWHSRRQRYRLPPGPKGLPIIGNTLDMPSQNTWLIYEKWSQEYSDCRSLCVDWSSLTSIPGSNIIYLNVLGTHIIVLNSVKAVNEVLEKRSSTYSDRYVPSFRRILSQIY